jgi:hypothetical protein
MLLQNPDQILCTVRTGSKAAVPPRPAHGPPGLIQRKSLRYFAACSADCAVLPTYPDNKSFAVNIMHAQCYLYIVEVHGMLIIGIRKDGKEKKDSHAMLMLGIVGAVAEFERDMILRAAAGRYRASKGRRQVPGWQGEAIQRTGG